MVKQRVDVTSFVKSNRRMTGTEVRSATRRGSPSKIIGPGMVRSVLSVGKHQKQAALAELAGGSEVKESHTHRLLRLVTAWGYGFATLSDVTISDIHEVFRVGNFRILSDSMLVSIPAIFNTLNYCQYWFRLCCNSSQPRLASQILFKGQKKFTIISLETCCAVCQFTVRGTRKYIMYGIVCQDGILPPH